MFHKLVRFVVVSLITYVLCEILFLGVLHSVSTKEIFTHATLIQFDNTTIGFVNPYKKTIYNSLYSSKIYNSKPNFNWNQDEQDFVLSSLYTGLKTLALPKTKSCIYNNSSSYPFKDYNLGLFSLFHNQNPYENITTITQKQNFYVFAIVENNDETTIAKTVFTPYSVAMKHASKNIPGVIYLDKTQLDTYSSQQDIRNYAGILVHEALHLFNHSHPGDSIETKYTPNYFINVAERCVNGTQT